MTAKTGAKQFKTHVDLPEATRTAMIDLCNKQLASAFDLFSQTKQAHWNVKGSEFYQLHLLFDDLAEHVEDQVDLIAERATALGGTALGTARMAAANSALPEFPLIFDGLEQVKALVERYGDYASSSRAAIDAADEHKDLDTADLFTEISRQVDKDLWFLEAHLQG
ncbi:MAG TPA: DNA starvation/stationary phase protection protein Dps [Thermomicrobiales bacterium]|jgi:starvation-inducible DNA-binding protein|nr:DNA starvation/stationary phase protection protein Dps [Thermomicrobiales bacterium]